MFSVRRIMNIINHLIRLLICRNISAAVTRWVQQRAPWERKQTDIITFILLIYNFLIDHSLNHSSATWTVSLCVAAQSRLTWDVTCPPHRVHRTENHPPRNRRRADGPLEGSESVSHSLLQHTPTRPDPTLSWALQWHRWAHLQHLTMFSLVDWYFGWIQTSDAVCSLTSCLNVPSLTIIIIINNHYYHHYQYYHYYYWSSAQKFCKQIVKI